MTPNTRQGDKGTRGQGRIYSITHYLCPMTAGASSRGTRPTHCLPNAQCPSTINQRNE
ncbi:hypothetical protein PI95_015615 [Hassallia byssoidea VB512170]|uniref:Uncharacterized protein n=1 Tax=Hassallia byssoidea VB512170 TaxID=1304833 RepID=A0A846H9E7_9CYAN|nr:hypothetical protein [Hassalia byssoidea]NEU73945.1 hypothetical protein [Hassalia byssoidea VB512170]